MITGKGGEQQVSSEAAYLELAKSQLLGPVFSIPAQFLYRFGLSAECLSVSSVEHQNILKVANSSKHLGNSELAVSCPLSGID